MTAKNETIGYCKGETCNRNDCKGIIKEYEKKGCCSCHINPPCGYCTEPNAYCEACGWDAKEEQYEYDKLQMEIYKNNEAYYEKQRIKPGPGCTAEEHKISPATWENCNVGDIVYCKVKGNFYTHLVKGKNFIL